VIDRAKICPACLEPFVAPAKRPRQRFCSRVCGVRRGAANSRHNGGLSFNRRLGRWVIVCRDGSLVYFYRGVAAAEIGRLLRPDELVHHVNDDSTDDDPANLEITTRAEHIEMHRADLMAGRRAA